MLPAIYVEFNWKLFFLINKSYKKTFKKNLIMDEMTCNAGLNLLFHVHRFAHSWAIVDDRPDVCARGTAAYFRCLVPFLIINKNGVYCVSFGCDSRVLTFIRWTIRWNNSWYNNYDLVGLPFLWYSRIVFAHKVGEMLWSLYIYAWNALVISYIGSPRSLFLQKVTRPLRKWYY